MRVDVTYRTEEKDSNQRVVVAEGYAFRCPPPCGFDSSGWATEYAAIQRATAHIMEHESGEPMIDLDEFIKQQGSEVVMSEIRAAGASLEDIRPEGVK